MMPSQYALLGASVVELHVNCNELEGILPDAFVRLDGGAETLFVNGNRNINGTLPLSLGASSSSLRLQALSLQNTSLNGPIPSSWSTVVQPLGYTKLYPCAHIFVFVGLMLCDPGVCHVNPGAANDNPHSRAVCRRPWALSKLQRLLWLLLRALLGLPLLL